MAEFSLSYIRHIISRRLTNNIPLTLLFSTLITDYYCDMYYCHRINTHLDNKILVKLKVKLVTFEECEMYASIVLLLWQSGVSMREKYRSLLVIINKRKIFTNKNYSYCAWMSEAKMYCVKYEYGYYWTWVAQRVTLDGLSVLKGK